MTDMIKSVNKTLERWRTSFEVFIKEQYEAIVGVAGSIYSRPDPGRHDPENHVWHPVMHPLTQADFVGWFTVTTIGVYSAVLWLSGEYTHIPPLWSFYFPFLIAYLLFWGSLYLEALPAFGGRIKRFWKSVIRPFSENIDDTRQPTPKWRPPHFESHTVEHTAIVRVAARVHLLVFTSIVASCGFTLYSGGPFRSAYSPILTAYPLFAVSFARNRASLFSVYATTLSSMLAFEGVRSLWFNHYEAQNDVRWYITVTAILLFASLLTAWVNSKFHQQSPEQTIPSQRPSVDIEKEEFSVK